MPLGAKVRVPPPRRALLDRPRLANPFRSPSQRPRLVLLAAPPGFGKTTLLTQWLAQVGKTKPGHSRVAWLTLDETDADVAQFVSDLVDSLEAAGGSSIGDEARALLDTGRSFSPELLLASVINELEVQEQTVIALDDLHRASSPDTHRAIAFLLDNLPPQVVMAVTTRADPPLPLARMRARGELVEVRAADLRLDDRESDAFLRDIMSLELDPAQVGRLESRTEGWVAGLQLAALSVRARTASSDAVDSFIQDFSGSHRFVLDYLVEEVLDTRTAEEREFLLLTSVLGRMNERLCDAVTGTPGGQRQLERLESANLFVTALDEDRRWFRYHQLFAEALQTRLASEYPDRVAAAHLAASRCLASLGQLDDAIDHALLADQPDWLADLVECALPGIRKRRADRHLLRWISGLPDDRVGRRPVLATTRAWSRLVVGDLADASRWLQIAENAVTEPASPPPQDFPPDLLEARERERRSAPANIAIYRAATAQSGGDVAQTVRQAELARDAAPDDDFVQGAAAGFLGLAFWAAGDLPRAIDTFRDAVAHMGAAGDITDQLGATVVLADMSVSRGAIHEARRLYEHAIDSAARHRAAAAPVAADLHTGLAGVLVEQDELESAARQLELALDLGESASLQENRFRWHAVSASLMRASGDIGEALEQLDQADRLYLPGFFPDLRPLAAARARVLVAGGRYREARLWADGVKVAAADPAQFSREYELLTYARLLIAEHRARRSTGQAGVAQALHLLERVLDSAQRAQRRGSVVEIRLLQALALSATGNVDAAEDALVDALEGGVPSGFVRLFLAEGEPLTDLLSRLVARSRDADTAALARQLLGRRSRPASPRPVAPGQEPLSERELEVLRLLATDLTGPEIASRLFVSINTLRTHSRHIFTKLDVTTRRAAVSRARDRGLL